MPAGRPPKYDKVYHPDMVHKLALLGLTDKEMADVLDISESTFNKWKLDHKEFSESVTRGKTIADAEVAASFKKKAQGYQYTETHSELREGSMVVTKEIIKEVQPDAGAALNWLKNRQKDRWRDKQEVESTNTHTHTIKDLDQLSDEELTKIAAGGS